MLIIIWACIEYLASAHVNEASWRSGDLCDLCTEAQCRAESLWSLHAKCFCQSFVRHRAVGTFISSCRSDRCGYLWLILVYYMFVLGRPLGRIFNLFLYESMCSVICGFYWYTVLCVAPRGGWQTSCRRWGRLPLCHFVLTECIASELIKVAVCLELFDCWGLLSIRSLPSPWCLGVWCWYTRERHFAWNPTADDLRFLTCPMWCP